MAICLLDEGYFLDTKGISKSILEEVFFFPNGFKRSICEQQLQAMMPLRMVAGTEFPLWQRLSSHFSNFPNAFPSAGIWVQVYALSAFKPQDTNAMCIVHDRSNKYLYKCHAACKWQGFPWVLAWGEALIKRRTYKWVEGKHLLSGCSGNDHNKDCWHFCDL